VVTSTSSGPGLFGELHQESSLETSYQQWRSGVHPGKAASSRTEGGDRDGLRDTYNIAQASPRHLSPSLNKAPGP